ncbi:hypothetical protein EDB84DRAFT_1560283 [Lactarius hengduanensis]|nr:hypothetical protein EDB84DRAFT_1560283 [Lactarius hengduanensis]
MLGVVKRNPVGPAVLQTHKPGPRKSHISPVEDYHCLNLHNSLLILEFTLTQILLGYKKCGFGAYWYNGFGGKAEAGESAQAARELKLWHIQATPMVSSMQS